MKKTTLRKYAKLVALKGVNVQKGQDVVINAGLDQPEFVTMVAEECYKAGARSVDIRWSYQPAQKNSLRYKNLKTLSEVDEMELARWKFMAEKLPCLIFIDSDDPDGMSGLSKKVMGKLAKSQQARYPVIKPYRDAMENKYQWTIVAVPGEKWAKKLFPGMRTSQAMEKLWQAILDTCRVWDDPVAEWDAHNADLKARSAYLNSLGVEKLHYHSDKSGTEFTVGMIPQGQFCGGSEDTLSGVTFNPNMPTEECFISPMKGDAEGIVYATKPLCYEGQLIENFSIRFEGGKAVEWHAEKNEELLTKLITMDEGSCYLGECALVPFSSPINESGILFYNTLFDENAVCHLALGMGFPDTIKGFEEMSLEEVRARGVNDSMVHEDFMIGSEDLCIDAICRDGRTVPVFRGGTWAF